MQHNNNKYPDSLLPSLHDISFVCPICREGLDVSRYGFHCGQCWKLYSLHGGIPDFRVFPDPFLDFQEDHDRTELLLAALDRHNLESLLEYYWSLSDITPKALRGKFMRSAMLGEQRAKRTVNILEGICGNDPANSKTALEVGSGTGNFLSAAAPHYRRVIGTDIAMRWLHVSRRRFMDFGMPVPPLVCCCAEHLPFPDGMFDLIVSSGTLEFVSDQNKTLSECARCMKDDGILFVNTVNRFSVAQDPYAYLWGVGFLPRSLQAQYVRWRRNAVYENTRLISFRELDLMAARYFSKRAFFLPDVDDSSLNRFPAHTRLQVKIYRRLKGVPPFAWLLRWFGPGWDAVFSK